MLTPEQHEAAIRAEYNFDHPNSFDFDRLHQCLKRLREGKSVDVPVYNFVTHSREKYSVRLLLLCFCSFYYFILFIIHMTAIIIQIIISFYTIFVPVLRFVFNFSCMFYAETNLWCQCCHL